MRKKGQLWYLWIGLIALVAALIWHQLHSRNYNLAHYKSALEAYLHPLELEADVLLTDSVLQRQIALHRLQQPEPMTDRDRDWLANVSQKPYTFCLFTNDSVLLSWTRNDAIPNYSDIAIQPGQRQPYSQMVAVRSSLYELRYRFVALSDSEVYKAGVLIPLKKDYSSFKGGYLNTHFPASASIPFDAALSPSYMAPKDGVVIQTVEGQILAYLSVEPSTGDRRHDLGIIVFLLIAFIGIGLFGYGVAKQMLIGHSKPYVGIIFFATMLILMVLSVYAIQSQNLLRTTDLKLNVNEFPGAQFVHSISSFLIYVVFFYWAAVFISDFVQLNTLFKDQSFLLRHAFAVCMCLLIVGFQVIYIGVINDFVLRWVAMSNIGQFFQMNMNSFWVMTTINILGIAFFILTRHFMGLFKSMNVSRHTLFSFFTVAIGFGYVSLEWLDLGVHPLVFAVLSAIYLLLVQFTLRRVKPLYIISMMVCSVIVIQTHYFIVFLGEREDTLLLENAKKLSRPNDVEAESELKRLIEKIQDYKPIVGTESMGLGQNVYKQLEEKVTRALLEEKYLASHYVCRFFGSRNGVAVINGSSSDLATMTRFRSGQAIAGISQANCRLYSDDTIRVSYVAYIPIALSATQEVIELYIDCRTSNTLTGVVFNELRIDDYYRKMENVRDYAYVVYHNNRLMEQRGAEMIASNLTFSTHNQEYFTYKSDSDRRAIEYYDGKGTVVYMVRTANNVPSGFPIFAFIILYTGPLVLGLLLLSQLWRLLPNTMNVSLAYAYKQHFWFRMILPLYLVLILSFGIYQYLINKSYREYEEYLYTENSRINKNKLIQELDREFKELGQYGLTDDLQSATTPKVLSLSSRYRNAIHFFDTTGALICTSEPNLFTKGILSEQMNPVAFQALKNSDKVEYEAQGQIESFKYQTIFHKIVGANQQLYGYVELPYYARDREIRSMVAVYNLNVLFFLVGVVVAGGCTVFLTVRMLLRPIKQVVHSLQSFRLGGNTNQGLVKWGSEDEIGQLIEAYNEKAAELAQSYVALAESERESAWRDMAKQVAHEIRNPLTPMKLVVQHLEMIRRQGHADMDSYLARANKVLIDQIDNLENIVTAFSNYAKMPQAADKRYVVINTIVASACNLFNTGGSERKIHFNVDIPDEPYTIFADDKSLLSAFNNLVKNAIQAIELVNDDREGEIDVRIFKSEKGVIVQIKDNGAGMSEEAQRSAFRTSFSTKHGGSGIGLLVTKNVIEAADGHIHFESVENEGTTFIIEFKRYDNP